MGRPRCLLALLAFWGLAGNGRLHPEAAAYVAVVAVACAVGAWDAHSEVGRYLYIFAKLELRAGNDHNLVIILVPVVARHESVCAGIEVEPVVDGALSVH